MFWMQVGGLAYRGRGVDSVGLRRLADADCLG